ncbi:LAMI_0D03334g1_1 [Lachancea mirantina]|uniref:LAMI_0D03334g1_1 n=1 Tax=Lachancea mirantina TaxID=1230905 RepID=A0A1G4J9N5_9SACH|nr:LAMI_0D03334g1_1 [Lachancea mirantina]
MYTCVPFKQVDVFTAAPYKGNPVAVVNLMDKDESEYSTEYLQSIANWTNLSETTFLLKPTKLNCDYKLRIFTPASELPFAGHPTVGSCWAFHEFTGKTGNSLTYQECGLGVVEITRTGETLLFKAAKADIEEISHAEVDAYEEVLNTKFLEPAKLLQVGPKWIVCLVKDAEICYNLEPDFQKMKEYNTKFNATGLIVAGKKQGEDAYEMRAFAPAEGVSEDPVCGSGALALARCLQSVHNFQATYSFKIYQGGRLGRKGQINAIIEHVDSGINYKVGGRAVTVVDGTIKF